MKKSRRDFLTLGATTALAAMTTEVEAQETKGAAGAAFAVPVDERLRLVSYSVRADGPPMIGAVKANGRIVDITGAAGGAKSMVALIEAGPVALAEIRKLVAAAKDDGPLVRRSSCSHRSLRSGGIFMPSAGIMWRTSRRPRSCGRLGWSCRSIRCFLPRQCIR